MFTSVSRAAKPWQQRRRITTIGGVDPRKVCPHHWVSGQGIWLDMFSRPFSSWCWIAAPRSTGCIGLVKPCGQATGTLETGSPPEIGLISVLYSVTLPDASKDIIVSVLDETPFRTQWWSLEAQGLVTISASAQKVWQELSAGHFYGSSTPFFAESTAGRYVAWRLALVYGPGNYCPKPLNP